MLYKLHNNILIVGLLSIGVLGAMAVDRSCCLMTLGTVFAFMSQLGLLMFVSREDHRDFSEKTLFWTVLLYSLLIGAAFMLLSVYYSGDTFMFSKSDARFYYENSMKTADIGLTANIRRFTALYDFDDCGALVFDSVLMAIIPSKFFLNAVYMLTGAFSAVMLFRIGQHLMPRVYAYLAGLAYGTSSFLIFFHCTFLKESIFVFLVICAMYFFYEAVLGQKALSYLWTAFFLFLILFFRPAVSAMLVVGFLAYFAVSKRGHAVSLIFFIMIAVLLPMVLIKMQDMVFEYTRGNMEGMIESGRAYDYSSSFSWFVSWFSAPFGPFPSLFPKVAGQPITINFYGAGLTYRLFLTIPLWLGIGYSWVRRDVRMIPLTVYVLVGMLGTGYVLASLELRKVMTHVPFTFLLAFYGLYHWNKSGHKQITEPFFYLFSIGVLVLWNLIRG